VANGKIEVSELNGSKHCQNQPLLDLTVLTTFICVIPKYCHCATFSKDLLAIIKL
jgi:hypothetical protein